jgi:hypothetical protein
MNAVMDEGELRDHRRMPPQTALLGIGCLFCVIARFARAFAPIVGIVDHYCSFV